MAEKTNCIINGKPYYRLTKTVGRKLNKNGIEVPVKKQFYGKSKKEAEQKFADFMERQKKGISTDKSYFGVVAEHWIDDYLLHDKTLAPATKERYINAWHKWFAIESFYTLELNKITPMNLQHFFNTTSAPLSSQRSILKMLRKFCKFLLGENLIVRDISASIVLSKREMPSEEDLHEIETWSDAELTAIFTGFQKAQKHFRNRFLLVMLANTGMRISEALGLKYSDFISNENGLFISVSRQIVREATFSDNGNKHILTVAPLKTAHSKRIIPVNDTVKREFSIHKAWHMQEMMKNNYRTDFMFTTSSGTYIDKTNLRIACNRYYKRIGVAERGFHAYRHTFATKLSMSGTPIEVTAKLLGHSDISITAKYYVAISPERMVSAVQAIAQNY